MNKQLEKILVSGHNTLLVSKTLVNQTSIYCTSSSVIQKISVNCYALNGLAQMARRFSINSMNGENPEYTLIWNPTVGEELVCKRESEKPQSILVWYCQPSYMLKFIRRVKVSAAK